MEERYVTYYLDAVFDVSQRHFIIQELQLIWRLLRMTLHSALIRTG